MAQSPPFSEYQPSGEFDEASAAGAMQIGARARAGAEDVIDARILNVDGLAGYTDAPAALVEGAVAGFHGIPGIGGGMMKRGGRGLRENGLGEGTGHAGLCVGPGFGGMAGGAEAGVDVRGRGGEGREEEKKRGRAEHEDQGSVRRWKRKTPARPEGRAGVFRCEQPVRTGCG